ncbi:MAG: DUF4349 domain-containing protein [Spirochaetota bacterium]|nr:DUF4349 domain-containing protein [Spirochaetota bacterium]
MKKKIIKGLVILGIGFVALWGLRVAYGYMVVPNQSSGSGYQDVTVGVMGQSRGMSWSGKNYASKKVTRTTGPVAQSVDQKYEKVATIKSQATDFKKDESNIRSLIKKHNALIQYEQKSGLKGRQYLYLAIGVHPEKFDIMYDDILKIGKVLSKRTDKSDKTNEFKELNAKKVSLFKARQSLIGLKGRGGKVEEMIRLEDRILQLEQEIQRLGVRLGEYDAENEFCTVKFTLGDKIKIAGTQISFLKRLKVAFEWTVLYYLLLIVILSIGLFLVWLALTVIEKSRFVLNALEGKSGS